MLDIFVRFVKFRVQILFFFEFFIFKCFDIWFRACSHFTPHLNLRGHNSGIEFNTLITKCVHGVVISVGQSPRNSVSVPVRLGLLPANVGESQN